MRDHINTIRKRIVLIEEQMLKDDKAIVEMRRAGRLLTNYLKSLSVENTREPSEQHKKELRAAMKLFSGGI